MRAVELDAQRRASRVEARLGLLGDAVHHELRGAGVDDTDWIEVERGVIGNRVRFYVAGGGHEEAGRGQRETARIQGHERNWRERVATAQVPEANAQQSDPQQRGKDPEGA